MSVNELCTVAKGPFTRSKGHNPTHYQLLLILFTNSRNLRPVIYVFASGSTRFFFVTLRCSFSHGYIIVIGKKEIVPPETSNTSLRTILRNCNLLSSHRKRVDKRAPNLNGKIQRLIALLETLKLINVETHPGNYCPVNELYIYLAYFASTNETWQPW